MAPRVVDPGEREQHVALPLPRKVQGSAQRVEAHPLEVVRSRGHGRHRRELRVPRHVRSDPTGRFGREPDAEHGRDGVHGGVHRRVRHSDCSQELPHRPRGVPQEPLVLPGLRHRRRGLAGADIRDRRDGRGRERVGDTNPASAQAPPRPSWATRVSSWCGCSSCLGLWGSTCSPGS